MQIEFLNTDFSVCKVHRVPEYLLSDRFCFVGKTDEELSLVCETSKVPENALAREDGWTAFRISGVLDFSLVGILAPIAKILADEKIGIFAVSTYNTDYVLIKKEHAEKAAQALARAGYIIK